MDELKRWGDEKPEVGCEILLWEPHDKTCTIMHVRESGPILSYNARWCYVPSAPDWDNIK